MLERRKSALNFRNRHARDAERRAANRKDANARKTLGLALAQSIPISTRIPQFPESRQPAVSQRI